MHVGPVAGIRRVVLPDLLEISQRYMFPNAMQFRIQLVDVLPGERDVACLDSRADEGAFVTLDEVAASWMSEVAASCVDE